MRAHLAGSTADVPSPLRHCSTLLCSWLVALSLPAGAASQGDAPPPLVESTAPSATADVELEEIVVTGTRLLRATALEGTIPVTSVEAPALIGKGDINLGEALSDLPSLRSTLGQDDTSAWTIGGLNILDLRGLGVFRTLVLVNGHRHITSAAGLYWVDVNAIPSDLVERVDIVAGGNSAIYGSDAVAGVVNFVMRRNFEGLHVRGQAGTSDKGDRDSWFGAVTAGLNFDEDRGNIAVAFEFSDAEPLYYRQRDGLTGAYRGRSQFSLAEPASGEAGGSDGIPDNRYFDGGVFNANIANGGLVSVNASGNPASTVYCGRLPEPVRSQRCLPNGQPRIFTFDRNGNLVETIPSLDLREFGSSNVVLAGSPLNPGELSSLRNTGQLAVGLNKASVNVLAHYDVTAALSPFLEAKFVRIDSFMESQPSFWQGSIMGNLGGGSELRCNNPYLSAQALAILQQLGRCANPATGTFTISRFNVDLGGRGEDYGRETFRVVAGVEGRFNQDWRYEVSLNYGTYRNDMRARNNLVLRDVDGNPDGFLLAVDAVRDTSGAIVCRVNADGNPTNDRPDCIPINVFGVGAPTAAATEFVNTTSRMREEADELVALAYVAGDTSEWFDLPGGPPAFVFGAESRREHGFLGFDDLTATGGTFYFGQQDFDPPEDLEVRDAFAELRLPVLRDLRFAQELTVEAAYRWSSYNNRVGNVSAYNAGVVYAPVPDLRLRGNFSTSVRAPDQWALFGPETIWQSRLQDPCDVLYVNANPNRAANCAAAGVPPDFVNDPARELWLDTVEGGNPDLVEEHGDSVTIGIVLAPRFLPGLTLAVDYYDIDVQRLIATVGQQQVLNQCYDAPGGIDNAYCAAVYRNADSTFASPAVRSQPFNYASQEARGLDFDVAYQTQFQNGHRLQVRGIGTYVLDLNNYLFLTEPNRPDRFLSELGDPALAFNAYVNYGAGPLQLGYGFRYVGKMTIGTYESQHAFDGQPAQNRDQYPRKWYPAVTYHDVRGEHRLTNSFSLFAGVDNLTDEAPPFAQLGTTNASPYDTIGRYYYLGFRIER